MLPINTKQFNISCDNEQIRLRNNKISMIAQKRNLQLLDLYSLFVINDQLPRYQTKDGIHLKSEAYGKWYNVISNIIYEGNDIK